MFKNIVLGLSVLSNITVLVVLSIYFFTSSFDFGMHRVATMKFFNGDHEKAEGVREQYIDGLECLKAQEDEGMAETEGFVFVEEEEMGNSYEGTATISGTYTYDAVYPHGIPLTISPDEEYLNILPGDSERFAISNYESLLDILLSDNLEECNVYSGEVTLEIDGYSELTAEIGGSDTTSFTNVVSYSDPVCD